MDRFSFLNAAHLEFIGDLYDQYVQYPDSIEPSWKAFFQGYDFANATYDGEPLFAPATQTAPNRASQTTQAVVDTPEPGDTPDKPGEKEQPEAQEQQEQGEQNEQNEQGEQKGVDTKD